MGFPKSAALPLSYHTVWPAFQQAVLTRNFGSRARGQTCERIRLPSGPNISPSVEFPFWVSRLDCTETRLAQLRPVSSPWSPVLLKPREGIEPP